MGKWKGIVGKSFTVEEFKKYVETLQWTDWIPDFIVLHNTGVPSLSSYPNGLTSKYINQILADYYRYEKGWSAGPHLFVDDKQIWVFTPLTTPGVHSPSWNNRTLGVEMLGNYDVEKFNSGRGELVKKNAVAAIAILSDLLGIAPDTMKLHREDPGTDHHCPGDNVNKKLFIKMVEDYIDTEKTPVKVEEPVIEPVKVVVEPVVEPVKVEEQLTFWQSILKFFKLYN
jgi:hypothetical protein